MATVKGTWRFNASIVYPASEINQYVNFTCPNGVPSDRDWIRIRFKDEVIDYFYSGSSYRCPAFNGSSPSTGYGDLSVVDFGTTEQEVSNEFYACFTANATRIDEEQTPIATITYKGETLETLNGGEYVTLHTKGQMMEDDIRVDVAVAPIT